MSPSLFSATGVTGQAVDRVLLILLGMTLALLVLITFLLVFFVIRYSKKRHPRPEPTQDHPWLEIGWTVAPTILVLAMFYYGVTGYDILRHVPRNAMLINVTARQWSWLFTYENGLRSTTLRVPVGRPVKLLLASEDVIHGFYVPAFRIKQDVVPGMQTYVWFQATQPGTYDVFCTQYCGLEHAHMLSKVEVLSPEDFASWYQSPQSVAAATSPGAMLYQTKGCVGCHSTDGSSRVGPSFKNLYGSIQTVTRAGKEQFVTVDEAYCKSYILDPNKDVVKGYPPIMPSQKGRLTDEEIDELVDYIEELK